LVLAIFAREFAKNCSGKFKNDKLFYAFSFKIFMSGSLQNYEVKLYTAEVRSALYF
jgi:hypothetical protein